MLNYYAIAVTWFSLNTLLKYKYTDISIVGTCLSFVHSVTTTLLTYPYIKHITSAEYNQEIIIYNDNDNYNDNYNDHYNDNDNDNYHFKYILCSTLCFYMIDLTTVCIPMRLYKYITHHTCAIIMIMYMLVDGRSLNIAINILFYAECSVPIYILYNQLNIYKNALRKPVLCVYNCVGTWTRVIKFTEIFVMFSIFSPINSWIIVIPSGIICIGSIVFQWSMWGVLLSYD